MIELAVLGLLRDENLHGYELRRRLADLGFKRVSFGALYPALRRLERAKYIAPVGERGRRKLYRLTEAGVARFDELVAADPEDDQAFRLRVAFFSHIDKPTRLEVLTRYRRELVERLAAAEERVRRRARRSADRMDRYAEALVRRGLESARLDLAWLDELIAEEHAPAAPRAGRITGAAPEPT